MGFVEVSHRIFGSSSWHFVHILEVPYEILYIFWKFLIGFCAFLEVLHRICGSFSWDSWKFLMGFCAYLRVPHGIVYILELPRGILCIIGRSSWDFVHIFSWDFVYFWKFLMGFCVFLEVPHGILCIFGSSSWDFVYFWKFLMGCCAFLKVPHGQAYTCPFHSFTFPLQNTCFCNMHTDWLRLSLAATSSKRHPVITNNVECQAERCSFTLICV
jgi:hypothetical protein